MAADRALTVLLLQAIAPRSVQQRELHLKTGSTVLEALIGAGVDVPLSDAEGRVPGLSVWGRRVALDHRLREGDRLELTRALRVDPKVARRERFARQGSRTAGLFQQRRPGAKAGY